MSKGSNHDPAKERFWREHIRRWQASSLSIRQYYAHLVEPSFYAWRRTLRQRDRSADAPASLDFVPIHVLHDLPIHTPVLELVLRNGRLLRIPADIDPRLLSHLLASWEREPC